MTDNLENYNEDTCDDHDVIREAVQNNPGLSSTISLNFTLKVLDPEGDLEDPENWGVALGVYSGEFDGVPDIVQAGLFHAIAGVQHGFFNHQEILMDWAMHEMEDDHVEERVVN